MYRYRHQIRALLALLLLLAVAYGVLKAWMYINAKQALEELSVASGGQVELSYDAIDTTVMDPSVTVRGITVAATQMPVPLRVDAVRVSGPPLTFFLLGQKQNEPPPERMHADMSGFTLQLDPELFESLQAELGGSGDSDACGPSSDLDPELLREIGFEELVIDAVMRYGYDNREQRFDGDIELTVHDVERIQAEITLEGLPAEAFQGHVSSIPTLAGMRTEFTVEPEFGERYLAACAARNEQDVDSFREELINRTMAQFGAAGVQLGLGLSQAVREFHQTWGTVEIAAAPDQPINPMALMFSPPQNWQRTLGIGVTLNGREVTDLTFTMAEPDATELAILLGQEDQVPRKPRKPQPRYKRVYQPLSVNGLSDNLGARVKLHLHGDQPLREGLVVAVSVGEVQLEQRLHGGKFTAHVPLEDVARVEIQRVVKIEPPKK